MITVPLRILLIDDEPAIVITFRIALNRHGYSVETAMNAEEGLAMALERDYDLIIVDFKMPGVTGVELVQRVRGTGNSVPILIMSAADSPVGQLAHSLQANVFFEPKPMKPDSLQGRVLELTSARTA